MACIPIGYVQKIIPRLVAGQVKMPYLITLLAGVCAALFCLKPSTDSHTWQNNRIFGLSMDLAWLKQGSITRLMGR
ncbi:MAG: hypothetical protein RL563_1836 [Pseudomonadota bacterium]